MALREVVTGSDACTADNGAGPSNAFASLANNLLGTSSKDQERLREIPGFHGLPGTSEAKFVPQRPQDAALAAAEGGFMHGPGFAGPSSSWGQAAGSSKNRPAEDWQAEFEGWQGREQRVQNVPTSDLTPLLHAFVKGGHAGPMQFRPQETLANLSVEEQCKIRDRSTIMARQIFQGQGDVHADEQVGKLLHSLHIDPRALPSSNAGGSWDQIFQNGRTRFGDDLTLHDTVMRNRLQPHAKPEVDRWADQFANLNLANNGDDMAREFLQQAFDKNEDPKQWAQEFMQGPGQDWAAEFAQDTENSVRDGSSEAALEQTRALRDTMAASSDPKFRNSQFLQFVSKMSRGEIILEDNQAKEVPGVATGNAWAEEHAKAGDVGNSWAAQHAEQEFENIWNAEAGDSYKSTWADEFQNEMHPPNAWADQFAAQNSDPEQWAEDFAAQHMRQDANSGEYQMAPNNPFLSDLESFAKGKELFRNGLLSEARLAFEAEVQRNPGNVEAWRLLGTVHAENDNDLQAIAALGKALAADPGNPEILLSLGVSHTNELDQNRALTFLLDWLRKQPGQAQAASVQLPNNAREQLRAVVDIFRTATQINAGSADAHVALGVLYNLARDFDGAVGAFRTALQTRTQDYSLWNKLGATLANSGRSGEAIAAYQKALDLKPNYMRAWTNMGIAQANVGEYENSARYYVQALGLNSEASNVWGYLRTSLSCAGRDDLMQAVEDENVRELLRALPL